jgi:hypothetical protein
MFHEVPLKIPSRLSLLRAEITRVLIDLQWVRAPTVPLHLCLIDGPFVPHNLISAHESHVPLPKCQMAPRFKN